MVIKTYQIGNTDKETGGRGAPGLFHFHSKIMAAFTGESSFTNL